MPSAIEKIPAVVCSPMSVPHTLLFLAPPCTIVISGPHIQALNGADVRHTTTDRGPIRCAALAASGTHLATAGDDKLLKIWAVDGLAPLSARELPKRPTALRFTADGQTVLVADKFGDVFRCARPI